MVIVFVGEMWLVVMLLLSKVRICVCLIGVIVLLFGDILERNGGL